MNIQAVLDFYHNQISTKEFINILNVDKELQEVFNKSVKIAPAEYRFEENIVNGIHVKKSIFIPKEERVQTPFVEKINQDYKSACDDKLESGKTIRDHVIWLDVREFLSKGKNIQYLSQKDINELILKDVTDMALIFYAEKDVENFIENNIISKLGKIESLSKAIKETKEMIKTLFTYERKAPYWAQACEWPIENGKPMIFISQKREGEKVTYTFKDSKSQFKEIVQYY